MHIDTEKVREAFDRLSQDWDSTREADSAVIEDILDAAGITGGASVLDAACGTGVLFPFILARGVRSLTGADISGGMIRRSREKFHDPRITLFEGDVETLPPAHFDRIIVFNAFPHFPDPRRLIDEMASRLTPRGRLTIAHDAGRAAVNARHKEGASEMSRTLPPASEVAKLFAPRLSVDTVTDNERLYIVSGVLQSDASGAGGAV